MPAKEGHIVMASGKEVKVVVSPISLFVSVCGGPSIAGAAVVDDIGDSGCGASANISGSHTGRCGACQRDTGF